MIVIQTNIILILSKLKTIINIAQIKVILVKIMMTTSLMYHLRTMMMIMIVMIIIILTVRARVISKLQTKMMITVFTKVTRNRLMFKI